MMKIHPAIRSTCYTVSLFSSDVSSFPHLGEPDSPVLSLNEKKLEKNSVSIPIKQLKDGGSPVLHYLVRYKGVSLNHFIVSFMFL